MITVNAMGDICPIPVVKTKKVMDALTGPDQIEVLVDNETAMRNVMKLAKNSGAQAEQEQLGEKEYRVLITVGEEGEKSGALGTAPAGADDLKDSQPCPTCIGTVVAVGSDRMGDGSDELGHILMKSFLFAVTQLDILPDKILFYNGGAKLTIEGSESLDDLKSLEDNGVEIMTCGTCLDYYGIKDKLAVGSVTNMYSIVEILQGAMSVLCP
ncbi:MAG TPA: sulfurtransferase-like selenium metabolism protein YedF [Candidatus Mediterraneibacter intestinipullorum]|nr:sulfurtransferase-like selenium metabolism protein YedF [Candidatus Mediterraneibacter intestinipullorum]